MPDVLLRMQENQVGLAVCIGVNLEDFPQVIALAESITVPAGTFEAVVFQKIGSDTPKRYWYVAGVGKVKETGGQTEELTEYELLP